MVRRLLVPAILAIAVVLVPVAYAGAGAGLPALHAHASATSQAAPLPAIKQVRPLKAEIGGKLTITGKNFLPGKGNTTVVFLRDGAPAVFLKAAKATKTRTDGQAHEQARPVPDRQEHRREGPDAASACACSRPASAPASRRKKLSPVVSAGKQDHGSDGSTGSPAPTCTLKSAKAAAGADADGDALTNGRELQIKTDPVLADSDGDKIPDGYEFESALDLNLRALPYPGKRPYPNPLDPSDAGTDYDGDGLTLSDEHAAWVVYGGSRFPLLYSDGTQTSMGPVQTTPSTCVGGHEPRRLPHRRREGRRRRRADELGRGARPHDARVVEGGVGHRGPYTVTYLQTDWLDPDTDGDTLRDGPDDVDHDGYANQDEVTRGTYYDRDGVLRGASGCSRSTPACPTRSRAPARSIRRRRIRTRPSAPGDFTLGEPIPLTWPR